MSNVAIDLTKTVKEIITTMKTTIDNLNSDVATNKTAIDNLKTQILEAVYPVGSVYVSLTNSSNPTVSWCLNSPDFCPAVKVSVLPSSAVAVPCATRP